MTERERDGTIPVARGRSRFAGIGSAGGDDWRCSTASVRRQRETSRVKRRGKERKEIAVQICRSRGKFASFLQIHR